MLACSTSFLRQVVRLGCPGSSSCSTSWTYSALASLGMIVLSSRQLLGLEATEAPPPPPPPSVPQHKRIPGTRFLVDAFTCSGAWSTAYFLSHFHSDHYTGLTPTWDAGVIFCSTTTARLLTGSHLSIRAELVVALPMDTPVLIDSCTVTLVDANHCPGAVQILFDVPGPAGGRFVHTGDMRYSPSMKQSALLCNFVGADALFLDTTYCSPRFCFPGQQESSSYVARAIQEEQEQNAGSRTLFCIATYVIGKEKLLREVIRQCRCRLYVEESKLAMLRQCSQDSEEELQMLDQWFVTQPELANVHVVAWNVLGETWPFFRPNFESMESLRLARGADRVVGFVPTGWTCNQAFQVRSKPPLLDIHLVPYSEHSSYEELREYVAFLRPQHIVPTVGLDNQGLDGKAAESMRQHFRNMVDETASKRKFLKGFKREAPQQPLFASAFGKGAKLTRHSEQDKLHGLPPDLEMPAQLHQASSDVTAAVSLFSKQQGQLELELDKAGPTNRISLPAPPARLLSPKLSSRPQSAKAVVSSRKKKIVTRSSQVRNQTSILTFFKKQAPQVIAQQLSGSTQGEDDEKLEQLVEILGGNVTEEVASRLLQQAGGNVASAVDAFYGSAAGSTMLSEEAISSASSGQLAGVTKQLFCTEGKTTAAASVTLPPSSYDPKKHACWEAHEAAPYLHLARTFDLVEKEAGRLKTTRMLCNMFRSLLALSPNDVIPALYLTTNRLAPDYENVDLNVGASTVVSVIEEATGTPKWKLKDMYNTMGDLGDVAQACRKNQRLLAPPPALSIRNVFDTLRQISNESGSGSTLRKKSMVLSLLQSCREKEATYLVRTLVQNMRIGALERTVLPALAQALILRHEEVSGSSSPHRLKGKLQEASSAIVRAYNFLPSFDRLLPCVLKDEGLPLFPVQLCPGVPLKPMLAKVTNELPQITKHFRGVPFTCEFKYDGCRAQIHCTRENSIEIFSRNCENATSRFPDVVQVVKNMTESSSSHSFILDAEVVAVDRANGNKPLAFQSLSTRDRGPTAAENIKVEVCVFVFDILYLDGELLVDAPLRIRRQRMHELLQNARPGYFDFSAEMTVECSEDSDATLAGIDQFLKAALSASCEGLMLKALDQGSEYTPGKRGDAWLKIKKDYVDGLSDSLDLVPIGAWHGNGRKAGWYSPFLVACYDPDKEEFQSVCRVMSGFSDAFYEQMNVFYREGNRELNKKPSYYQTWEQPDVWLSAEVVWEIRGADYTISPVHHAAIGLVHASKGISVRFPRFVRARSDKNPEDATSSCQMAEHFQAQTRKAAVY